MPRTTLTVEQRFWKRVNRTDSCWLWTGYLNESGYGRFQLRLGIGFQAHRWAYERYVGPIPDGLVIDHLCRVRHCVNPAHMEPVTRKENIRRGLTQALKTHCKHGHPWTPENIVLNGRTSRGGVAQCCRPCKNERQRQYMARVRAVWKDAR